MSPCPPLESHTGGGSSSTTRLDNDEEVKFVQGDQYVGINEIDYGADKCLLYNWASTTKKKSNCAMATVVKPSGATVTKGRALEGDIAAHNLCVVSDLRAKAELQKMFDRDGSRYFAFAIGGEYRDPTDKRGKARSFDGVQLMGLEKHKYGASKLWSALEWQRLSTWLKGDHPGAIEGRSKCIRPSDGRGIAEFDGQSALTYFKGQFLVYARANPEESGYRTVQACTIKSLNEKSPFRRCTFASVPDDSDIYFLHPYVVPSGEWVLAIMSLVWPEGTFQESPLKNAPGIYLAASKDGFQFKKPVLLHNCESHGRRCYDLPVQGKIEFTETGISFYVHKNVPCRMSPKHKGRKEELVQMQKEVPSYIRELWRS